jgi:hypothetical protein
VARKNKKVVEAAITPEDRLILERVQALSRGHLSLAAIAGTLLADAIPRGPNILGSLFQQAIDDVATKPAENIAPAESADLADQAT